MNLRCVADYLTLDNREIRIKSSPILSDMRIDVDTMPQHIHREPENSEEFDEMLKCMDESAENYRILGNILPSFIRYEQARMRVTIQLKEPTQPTVNKLLKHAFISEDIADIIRK